jgi:hypothetical protein
MLFNFTEIFMSYSSIPVNILIEPLLKTMDNLSNSQNLPFNIFDYEFLSNLLKHPKLTLHPYGI